MKLGQKAGVVSDMRNERLGQIDDHIQNLTGCVIFALPLSDTYAVTCLVSQLINCASDSKIEGS